MANATTLPVAFEHAFGSSTLRRLHGDTFTASPWHKNLRSCSFELAMPAHVPSEIRRIFCGNRLRVSVRDRVTCDPKVISVRSKMRMHFVGSELFIVRPRYRLEPSPCGGVLLHAEVENHALLPPPLCGMVEAFMDASARAQLLRFSRELLQPCGPTALVRG